MSIAKTSLYLVQFPAGVSVCQVDDFPSGTARSRLGSVHVRPGTQKLTKGEYEHIQTAHKIRLSVLRKMAPKPPASAKKDGTAKAEAPAPAPAPAKKSGGKKQRSGGASSDAS